MRRDLGRDRETRKGEREKERKRKNSREKERGVFSGSRKERDERNNKRDVTTMMATKPSSSTTSTTELMMESQWISSVLGKNVRPKVVRLLKGMWLFCDHDTLYVNLTDISAVSSLGSGSSISFMFSVTFTATMCLSLYSR